MSSTPLIPRKILFDNPDRMAVKVSPDGQHVSYIAPHEGVLNVWVASRQTPTQARVLTRDAHRGIRSYFWAYDNATLLYIQDKDGDENWNLYAVNVQTGESKNLTPFPQVHAQVIQTTHKNPFEILVGLNHRSPEFHDVYRLNIKSGKLEEVFQNTEYAGFLADDTLTVRFGTKMRADGGSELYLLDGGRESKFLDISMEDLITTSPLGFNKNNTAVYMQDSRGRNTSALVAINIESRQETLLAEDSQADFCDALVHPTEKTIQGFASNYDRKRWQLLDKSIEGDLDYLWTQDQGDLEVLSRSQSDQWWVVGFLQDNGPVRYYLYDRQTRHVQFLFTSKDMLQNMPLVPMHPVKVTARDDLEMVCYLSLPQESDPDQTGRPHRPLPMVLLVHGGPTARDEWGYSGLHQWLANRGYAVLSVNYRGSTGFGKDHIVAGYGQWAGGAHNDLVDAVHWAIDHGIADSDKVAIMGGSYGGYATLVGLAMTPKVFACGGDIVGPSNLQTLLESVPPYWKPMLDMLKVRIGGDHETESGREFLRSQSPLTFAHQIERPLLIGQGANDPRVKKSESDQIVNAMKRHGIPVTYVLYPDEGHGFARPENRLSFYAVTETFLARSLGGRFEDLGEDFEGSSIQILEGEDGSSDQEQAG